MNSLQYISPIQSISRKKYYNENALKALREILILEIKKTTILTK